MVMASMKFRLPNIKKTHLEHLQPPPTVSRIRRQPGADGELVRAKQKALTVRVVRYISHLPIRGHPFSSSIQYLEIKDS